MDSKEKIRIAKIICHVNIVIDIICTILIQYITYTESPELKNFVFFPLAAMLFYIFRLKRLDQIS